MCVQFLNIVSLIYTLIEMELSLFVNKQTDRATL
jgi:hypothetical protein